jgi:uncharacterized protein YndB with AHSA1/START domain
MIVWIVLKETMMHRIETNVIINAPRSTVWHGLTNPASMQQWMGTPEMRLQIISLWKVAEPILITGFLHGAFENKGTIVRLEPEHLLCYTHLSSSSRLPDEPQNYSVLCFELADVAMQTSVTLTVDNFPTETIFKHLNFYWRTAMEVFKTFVEKQSAMGEA